MPEKTPLPNDEQYEPKNSVIEFAAQHGLMCVVWDSAELTERGPKAIVSNASPVDLGRMTAASGVGTSGQMMLVQAQLIRVSRQLDTLTSYLTNNIHSFTPSKS